LPRRPIALFVVAFDRGDVVLLSGGRGVKMVGRDSSGFPNFGLAGRALGAKWTTCLRSHWRVFCFYNVESISVARTFSIKHGYPISAGQELLARICHLAAGVGKAIHRGRYVAIGRKPKREALKLRCSGGCLDRRRVVLLFLTAVDEKPA